MPTALVTGASAGIGAALARVYAANGYDLVLTARREDRLQKLAAALATQHGVKTTVFAADLSDPAAPQHLYDRITAQGLTIDALINNAGYGVPGYFVNTNWASQRDFLQVLVTAPTHLCHLFLPGMIERGFGRILNIASLVGLLPSTPGQSLYGGAKSYIVQLSQTLWAETRGTGVHVTALCPGFTYSEFHDVTGTRARVNRLPKFMWMDAETVARQGFAAVEANRAVYVNGAVNRALATLAKALPRRVALRLVAGQSKSFRPQKPTKRTA